VSVNLLSVIVVAAFFCLLLPEHTAGSFAGHCVYLLIWISLAQTLWGLAVTPVCSPVGHWFSSTTPPSTTTHTLVHQEPDSRITARMCNLPVATETACTHTNLGQCRAVSKLQKHTVKLVYLTQPRATNLGTKSKVNKHKRLGRLLQVRYFPAES